MYKLAVLDIDGTLVQSNGKVSNKTIETIKKVKKAGGIVTVCTGRNIKRTLPVIEKAGIDVPFICIDGTIMYEPNKKQVLYDLKLSKDETSSIIDSALKHESYIEVSDGYKYYKYFKSKNLKKYDIFSKTNILGKINDYLSGTRYIKNINSVFNIPNPLYQVIVAGEVEKLNEIKQNIHDSKMERVEIRDYLWENYLFINRKGIKKSLGLKILCEHFNIRMDEVVAIGDESNDIDMLEEAGIGIAMGNASKRVKAAADDITLSNDENGVAAALEKYFL